MADDDLSSLRRSHVLPLYKSRGQNFLTDAGCARRIARCCDVGGSLSSSLVLEIGAGTGSLTRALFAEGARRVVALESDARLAALLREAHGGITEGGGALEIIEADARELDYVALLRGRREEKKQEGDLEGSVVIVGNLPYSVATVILRKILENGVGYRLMVLMFQREVAERLTAKANDSSYGRLSVLVALRCRVERCFDVSPQVFFPVPKVVSRVLRFLPRGNRDALGVVSDEEYRLVGEMTSLLFSHRRKRMRGVLRKAKKEEWLEAGEGLGLDLGMRAGEMEVEQWLRWAKEVRKEVRSALREK